MADERGDLTHRARLAEQAERYDDMANFMRKIAQMDGNLTSEERNLLSVAYKNVVGARRSSWRVLRSLEDKEESKGEKVKQELVKCYRVEVEKELCSVCSDVLALIEDHLIPNVHKAEDVVESEVFFLKMKGDYYRYIAEVKIREDSTDDSKQKSKEAYESATTAAKKLKNTNPIHLGLALNFSVFYYEILNEPKDACELAKTAFESAVAELEELKEDTYKDSTLIMQLLRDNLTLWSSENDGDDEQFAEADNNKE